MRQYSRITVKMEDMNHTNKLQVSVLELLVNTEFSWSLNLKNHRDNVHGYCAEYKYTIQYNDVAIVYPKKKLCCTGRGKELILSSTPSISEHVSPYHGKLVSVTSVFH